jgi:hypothetical protein
MCILYGVARCKYMSSRHYELPELFVLNIIFRYIDGLDGWGLISSRGKRFFSIFYRVQTGSGAHAASYPMGMGGRGKAARA